MTAIVSQARIDSSRLPGKSLLLIDNKPLLHHVMIALNQIPVDKRILACPQDSLSSFKPIVKQTGFEIITGSKEDVLDRYCKTIKKYSIKRLIRATADNPFVFTDAALSINNEALAKNADYAGYTYLPYGAGVESVSASALLLASESAALPFEREHVCPYLYNNPNIFNLHRPSAPSMWRYPDIRLTVDTQEDYDRAVELYTALKNKPLRYNGCTIIKYYKKITGS